MASYGLTIGSGVTITSGITFPSFESDDYFEYTTLLLPGNGTNTAQNNTFQDGSTNNFTITRNGNTTQGTFSPFSQTGWGNYFSANTSELSFASNAAFNLSGVSLTIEFWTYPTENAPARERIWITRRQASGAYTSSYQIYCGSGANTLKFFVTGQTVVTSTSSLTPNQWNHVAVVWNGTTLYFYINGVQDATTGTYGAGTGADAEPLRIGRLTTTDNVLSYMSNVRVVKGVAVYTGNFTVPSTPLAITQSSGTNILAITGTQTSLLTCQTNRFVDVTANAFVPTVGTGTSVQAFSPFNPTASWSAATYGGSGYFDGSGDYLQIPTNTAFNLGTGAFCVEFWVYITSLAEQPSFINNNSTNIFYETSGLNRGLCLYASAAAQLTSSTTALPLNAWNHVVICRNTTGTLSSFANGNRLATAASNTSTVDFSNAIINRYFPSVAGHLFGYTSDLRMVKGSTPYDPTLTTCTVPTAPLTAITNTSLLLNFTNAGIYDATSKNDLETVGNAQISTAISAKWGSGSMYFDGSGDILSSPGSQNYVFNGDFTVEGWVYIDSTMASSRPDNLKTFIFVGWNTGNTPQLYVYGTTSTAGIGLGYYDSTSSWEVAATVPKDQWAHIAYARTGSALYGFVNGTRYTINASISATIGSANTFVVGGNPNQVGAYYSYLKGNINDLRITKGYARYTANFTAPTAAFPTF